MVLPGQETLLACWSALTQVSPGARMAWSRDTAAAVFPAWAPLNNAVLLGPADGAAAAAAAGRLAAVYAEAGVTGWALWLATGATTFDAADTVRHIDGLRRDTTTLVMHTTLHDGHRRHDDVVNTSIATATYASGTAPVPVSDLGDPDQVRGLDAWVLVDHDVAVAGAWSFLHGRDLGIYTVGTQPEWRRRGLARTLMDHVIADAQSRGAETASLQSTRMGQPLYESLGFEAAGRYEEWVPQ